jgi:hypothetical protein
VKYFFDNDISPRFATMLRALDVDIVALRELYTADTKDPQFLGELKRKHGVDVFISNDTSQRTNPVEAKLLIESGVTSLYFNPFWSKKKFWDQAKWLITRWEKIEGFVRGATAGTCADLQESGRSRIYRF